MLGLEMGTRQGTSYLETRELGTDTSLTCQGAPMEAQGKPHMGRAFSVLHSDAACFVPCHPLVAVGRYPVDLQLKLGKEEK